MAEKPQDPGLKDAKDKAPPLQPLKEKKVIILFLGLLLLLASGAGAVYVFAPEIIPASLQVWEKKGEAEKSKVAEKNKEAEKSKEPDKDTRGHIYLMDPILVNLADTDKLRYLKIRINLESAEEKPNEEYDKRLPQLRDQILTVLSTKSQKDIVDSEGKKKLREEITNRVNQLLTQFKIQTVYFSEFVIQ
jgi:flagellar FliL protein